MAARTRYQKERESLGLGAEPLALAHPGEAFSFDGAQLHDGPAVWQSLMREDLPRAYRQAHKLALYLGELRLRTDTPFMFPNTRAAWAQISDEVQAELYDVTDWMSRGFQVGFKAPPVEVGGSSKMVADLVRAQKASRSQKTAAITAAGFWGYAYDAPYEGTRDYWQVQDAIYRLSRIVDSPEVLSLMISAALSEARSDAIRFASSREYLTARLLLNKPVMDTLRYNGFGAVGTRADRLFSDFLRSTNPAKRRTKRLKKKRVKPKSLNKILRGL